MQIKIYDEVGVSPKFYQRTYYDMFQAAITERRTVDQGREFARKAAEQLAMFCGNNEGIERFLRYASHPELHRNYLCKE